MVVVCQSENPEISSPDISPRLWNLASTSRLTFSQRSATPSSLTTRSSRDMSLLVECVLKTWFSSQRKDMRTCRLSAKIAHGSRNCVRESHSDILIVNWKHVQDRRLLYCYTRPLPIFRTCGARYRMHVPAPNRNIALVLCLFLRQETPFVLLL
jgi:hypothetical protein